MRCRCDSRAALAKLPVLRKSDLARAAEGKSAVRRLQRHAAGQGASASLMSPGPIFEPEGHERGFRRRCARACSRPAFAPGDIVHNCFRLSPDAGRLDAGGRRACARLRRSFPAASAIPSSRSRRSRNLKPARLYRHAGFSEDPARYRAEIRQGRSSLNQARRSFPARPCRPRCGRNWRAAASTCCNAMPSRRPA